MKTNGLELANPMTSMKAVSPRVLAEDGLDQQPATATAATTTTGARAPGGSYNDNRVDFIGPSKAVKHLFSLPYSSDRSTSVALHNMGNGTLLLDSGDDFHAGEENYFDSKHGRPRLRRKRPTSWSIEEEHATSTKEEDNESNQAQLAKRREEEKSLLDSLSLLLEEEKQQQQSQQLRHAVSDEEGEDENIVQVVSVSDKESLPKNIETALALPLNALVVANNKPTISSYSSGTASPIMQSSKIDPRNNDQLTPTFPPPQHYLSHVVAPPTEPRQYVDWEFQDVKMRVGSDLFIFNQQQSNSEIGKVADDKSAIAIQVADASRLRSQMNYANQESRILMSSLHRALPPTSYAEALKLPRSSSAQEQSTQVVETAQLQTRIIPVSGAMGQELAQLGFSISPLPAEGNAISGGEGGKNTKCSTATSPPSPVCTVLDTYLDNLIANVPQLALLLREQGFIQSIKLLRTEEIPSLMVHHSILGGEAPSSPEPVFDPDIVEMNASMLLRFLKNNCTRENSTYLLHRAANTTEIQLFDVSSISELGVQRKWVWWLALCSYRFACRLEHLQAMPQIDGVTRREYRNRQRNLLHNTLNLFEKLADIDSDDEGRHETIKAAVCEHLADTYLFTKEVENADNCFSSDVGGIIGKPVEGKNGEDNTSTKTAAMPCAASSLRYQNVSVDSLRKGHDHLMNGIQLLTPPLVKAKEDKSSMEVEAIGHQLYGIYHKSVNVCLCLADHYVKNYFSSNLIQSLRTAARMLSDAMSLLVPLDIISGQNSEFNNAEFNLYVRSILRQYAWLWEYCGHFARTFAADGLWRDRGHTCGADLLGLIREVNITCGSIRKIFFGKEAASTGSRKSKTTNHHQVMRRSHGQISLDHLSGVVILPHDFEHIEASVLQKEGCHDAIRVSKLILDQKSQIKREARQVLVAACVCYGHAIDSYAFAAKYYTTEKEVIDIAKDGWTDSVAGLCPTFVAPIIRQRLGDACNEIGKILLSEARAVLLPQFSLARDKVGMLGNKSSDMSHVSAVMLASAHFWFMEGLARFTECNDLRNIALLRCNLCQCSKIRANTNVVLPGSKSKNNSESHLQDAVDHLVSAHDAMGQRDEELVATWDMVSEELAATLLVLGVRRRQSAFSSSSPEPLMIQALRLGPGAEKSIVEPIERSCKIYESLGTARAEHQAAAAHYQLALYFSKVWTCQRDEAKTRDKLAAAFKHYILAEQYFSQHVQGNEATFVVLSLDFSNLYSAVGGEEGCLLKALVCCLDTRKAFSSISSSKAATVDQMTILAENVEARVSKLLLNLVKIEKENDSKIKSSANNYKNIYRKILAHKIVSKDQKEVNSIDQTTTFPVAELLENLSKDLTSV